MTTDIREICSLPEKELETRRASLNEHLFSKVRRREERPNGLALYFEETAELQRDLQDFIEFERVCCSSIDWSLDRDPRGLRLEINGIDPRSPTFAGIGLHASEPSAKADLPLWPRLLRSVGFGSLGALFVCCVLPLSAVALVGATPLLLLDNPWLISASAIGLGGFIWHREGRRQAQPKSTHVGGGKETGAGAKAGNGCGC